jgi:histidinol-phosphate phosphatase family protein
MNNPFAAFSIDSTWTLFLDRDGVINRRLVDDYVKHPGEFEFLDGVTDAIAQLTNVFGKIVVVTNQQGIGKGIYTHDDLAAVHQKMKSEIEQAGGRIDAVFYAPNLAAENSPLRKPGIGMALNAQHIFPQIDFSKSIMVGDTKSDMEFARNAGMKSVFCSPDDEPVSADVRVSSLAEFASYISRLKA